MRPVLARSRKCRSRQGKIYQTFSAVKDLPGQLSESEEEIEVEEYVTRLADAGADAGADVFAARSLLFTLQ